MRQIPVQDVQYGMVITDNLSTRDRTLVKSKTVRPDGCKGRVHLNSNECWDYGYPVYVLMELREK